MWGGMTRKSNSRSSVISLLGKFTSPRRICYPEIMVIQLRQDRDLEQLLDKSKTNPVLIFKHSTQCSISGQAYDEFREFAESAGELICGVVSVIEDRAVSNSIAERLNVRHETPQVIVIKDGRATWNASHWSITIFLLPNGEPIFGGTYFPPEDRYNRPGFLRVLQTIAEAYRTRRAEIMENAKSLREHLIRPTFRKAQEEKIDADLLDTAYRTIA